MKYIISLSLGCGSFVAGQRIIEKYGRQNVIVWFGNTLWEDEDSYRFRDDIANFWGLDIIEHSDGRTPLDVYDQRQIIPNNRIAPCSEQLKIEPFVAFLNRQRAKLPGEQFTVVLGLDASEPQRLAKPKQRYESIPGVFVEYPLTWTGAGYWPSTTNWVRETERLGLTPPRAYGLGFKHNNCGGRCIRQGKAEWLRLKSVFPERFEQMAAWERDAKAQAAKDGYARANYTILTEQRDGEKLQITLEQLGERGTV